MQPLRRIPMCHQLFRFPFHFPVALPPHQIGTLPRTCLAMSPGYEEGTELLRSGWETNACKENGRHVSNQYQRR